MEENLVTVIVPVYNVEKYVKTCIESIINQTYENLEIILVNDGSTDSSLEICKSYEYDKRIKVINKKNEGLSSARQAGIDHASGKFLCTVDSDDYIERKFVEKMYSMISSEKSDICICETKFYSKSDASYSNLWDFNNEISTTVQITRNDIETNYRKLLSNYYMSDSWNKMYNTEFIKNSGVRFSLCKEFNGTDLLFNHLLLLHLPNISIIREPLYNYQILENSRVRRKNKQLQKGFMIIISRIISEIGKLNYSDKINLQISRRYASLLFMAVQDIFNSGFASNELKKQYNDFWIANSKYLLENKRLTLKWGKMETLPIKLFCFLLNNRNSSYLYKYLCIRQDTLKMARFFKKKISKLL